MEFDKKMIADPGIFKINALPQHSDHDFYASGEEYLEGKTSLKESLNGVWYFKYDQNINLALSRKCDEQDILGFDKIKVPSHIQLEGYDTPAYVNTQYPWDGVEGIGPGEIPERKNPTGTYVRYFYVDEITDTRIVFEGAESAVALWINDSFIGYSEDSFTPSEFDISASLRKGENIIKAVVFKWTSSSWLEDQDMYRFSGIFRDVYLVRIPRIHIADLKISATPYFDSDNKGLLRAEGILNRKGSLRDAEIEYTICFKDQKIKEGSVKSEDTFLIEEEISDVRLWSSEYPNLYTVSLTVKCADEVLEYVSEKTGFREFKMINGIMCLNRKRIVFHGVNRHEFYTDTGRACVTEEMVREDILTMKRNNINAVRTCHYPDSKWIYRLCDEYGIYMIAENNMETHGIWDMIQRGQKPLSEALPGNREEYIPMMLDRIHSTYETQKNHPSVLIWSIGNESFGGRVPLLMSQEFKRLDNTRLVHYEGVEETRDPRYPETSDMYTQMYSTVSYMRDFLKRKTDKPLILCEYTHSMGNSNGDMFKYIDFEEENERYQGGFIWDFIDQALRSKNIFGEDYQAYGGDSGERPTDYDFSANGILNSLRKPYGKMQEIKYCYQPVRFVIDTEDWKIRIKNKNLFTKLSDYSFRISIEKEGKVLDETGLKLNTAPLSEEETDIPLKKPSGKGEYTVNVRFYLKENKFSTNDTEMGFGQGILKNECEAKRDLYEEASFIKKKTSEEWTMKMHPGVRLVRGSVNFGVYGRDFEILISSLKGGITSYKYCGRELLSSIPRPNFWRAPVQNDTGNQMGFRYGIWKTVSLYQTTFPIEAWGWDRERKNDLMMYPILKEDEDSVFLRFKHFLPTNPMSCMFVTYRVLFDGKVEVRMEYESENVPMPEFGFMMKIPKDFKDIKYYGLGPEENYCDRNKGARLSVFEGDVTKNPEPYIVPQETGNRSGVRWAEIRDHKKRGIRFESLGNEGMDFSAIPYTPEMLEEAMHYYELPRIKDTVVRLSLSQMGVGGDDSWGARVHDEFLLKPEKGLSFGFSFQGVI